MTHPMRAVLVAALALSMAGCSKDDKRGGGAGEPAAWKPFALTELGVVVDAPGNAKEHVLGRGITASEGSSDCSVNIHLVVDQALAYENLLDSVGSIGGTITDLEKEKTDAKNWVVAFVGDRKSGFQRSQQLGDKVVQCGGFGKPEAVACVKKICGSLRLATRP
jgi:hypothetical protein